jgi:hypothetical protein
MEAELGQEPTANEGAHDSDEEVADKSEPRALHDLTGEPASNEADRQHDQQIFTRHVHLYILRIHQTARRTFRPVRETQRPSTKAAWPK